MGKGKDAKKSVKKEATKTPKEKKAAKESQWEMGRNEGQEKIVKTKMEKMEKEKENNNEEVYGRSVRQWIKGKNEKSSSNSVTKEQAEQGKIRKIKER